MEIQCCFSNPHPRIRCFPEWQFAANVLFPDFVSNIRGETTGSTCTEHPFPCQPVGLGEARGLLQPAWDLQMLFQVKTLWWELPGSKFMESSNTAEPYRKKTTVAVNNIQVEMEFSVCWTSVLELQPRL